MLKGGTIIEIIRLNIGIAFIFVKTFNSMKFFSTLIFTFLIAFIGFSQKLTFKVSDVNDTTVHLVKYVGNKLYYADTAKIVGGIVSFDGSKQEPGILALLLPGQKYFDFIYNKEAVKIETKGPNYMENMVVKESKENKIFLEYLMFVKESRQKTQALQEQRKALDESQEAEKNNLDAQIASIGEGVFAYQNQLVAKNKNTLVAKIVKMSTDIQIPEVPESEKDNKNFSYEYFRDHYFDNIDFTDDRLVNTPILQNKLEQFYSKTILQHPDTILKYVYNVVDQIPEGSMMYRFFVTNITAHFEKSKIMGMDKVSNNMINRYYCSKDLAGNYKGNWMEDDRLDDLCETTKKRLRIMLGETPPNIILPDTTNKKWHNLYKVDAEYTILYFWEPNCGYCKTITPKLGELYEKKFKERNIEIFSVGKATGDDFEAWKKFIAKHNLNFINVGVTKQLYENAKADALNVIRSNNTTLESINYRDTYDIYSTPRVFILNKDKKIIAKSLTIAQIEHMLDDLQGFSDAEKLFDLKIETEEDQVH